MHNPSLKEHRVTWLCRPFNLDREQYRARVRVRYRRWLVRRGVPVAAVLALRSRSELLDLCGAVCRGGPDQ